MRLLIPLLLLSIIGYGQTYRTSDGAIKLQHHQALDLPTPFVFVNGIPQAAPDVYYYTSEVEGGGWAVTIVGQKSVTIGRHAQGMFETDGYTARYAGERPQWECDVDDRYVLPEPASTQRAESGKCVGVHVHADYSHVSDFGTTAQAIEHILAEYAVVSFLYAQEDISLYVSSLSVYDDLGSDPFAGLTSSSQGLNLLRSYVSEFGINGDLAQLLSDNGSGGLAYVGGLGAPIQNRVSFASIYGVYSDYPVYSWDIEVIAHELGHNLGSHHTHACAWNGNNTQIDDCGPTVGYTTSCYDSSNPILPDGCGTIMSYCHLTSRGICLGFHAQVANVMRARVANHGGDCNTGCLGPTNFAIDDVGATTATVTWVQDENYDYRLQFEGNIFEPVNSPYTLTGLQPSTFYTVSLRAICSDSTESFAAIRGFRTDCGESSTAPFYEGWDDGEEHGFSGIASLGVTTMELTADDDGYHWNTRPGTTNYGNSGRAYLYSTCFDLSGTVYPVLYMDVLWDCEAYWDGAKVQYSTSGGIEWTTLNPAGAVNWYNRSTVYALGDTPGWSGRVGQGSPGWVTASAPLEILAGESRVEFRVWFGSDVIFDAGTGFSTDNWRIVEGATDTCHSADQYAYFQSCNINQPDTTSGVLIDGDGCFYTLYSVTTPLPKHDITLPPQPTCNIEQDGSSVVHHHTNQYGCDSVVRYFRFYAGSDDTYVTAETCEPDEVGVSEVTFENQYSCDSTVITTTILGNDCDTTAECNATVDIGCQVVWTGFSTCAEFTATATGTEPLTFSWSHVVGDGIFATETQGVETGPTAEACFRVSGVTTVTVTDGKGCTATDEAPFIHVDARCGNGNSRLNVCMGGETMCLKRREALDLVEAGLAEPGACGSNPCQVNARRSVPTKAGIYPNPTNGTLFILGGDRFEIHSMKGQKVLSGPINGSIDVSEFPAGVYHVTIWNGWDFTTEKLIVE